MEYKHKTSLLINELTDIDQWDAIEHIQELAQHVAILQSNITQLEKENASLKQDAARYRMIRNSVEALDTRDVCIFDRDGWEIYGLLQGDELDQKIDTAMEASNAKAD